MMDAFFRATRCYAAASSSVALTAAVLLAHLLGCCAVSQGSSANGRVVIPFEHGDARPPPQRHLDGATVLSSFVQAFTANVTIPRGGGSSSTRGAAQQPDTSRFLQTSHVRHPPPGYPYAAPSHHQQQQRHQAADEQSQQWQPITHLDGRRPQSKSNVTHQQSNNRKEEDRLFDPLNVPLIPIIDKKIKEIDNSKDGGKVVETMVAEADQRVNSEVVPTQPPGGEVVDDYVEDYEEHENLYLTEPSQEGVRYRAPPREEEPNHQIGDQFDLKSNSSMQQEPIGMEPPSDKNNNNKSVGTVPDDTFYDMDPAHEESTESESVDNFLNPLAGAPTSEHLVSVTPPTVLVKGNGGSHQHHGGADYYDDYNDTLPSESTNDNVDVSGHETAVYDYYDDGKSPAAAGGGAVSEIGGGDRSASLQHAAETAGSAESAAEPIGDATETVAEAEAVGEVSGENSHNVDVAESFHNPTTVQPRETTTQTPVHAEKDVPKPAGESAAILASDPAGDSSPIGGIASEPPLDLAHHQPTITTTTTAAAPVGVVCYTDCEEDHGYHTSNEEFSDDQSSEQVAEVGIVETDHQRDANQDIPTTSTVSPPPTTTARKTNPPSSSTTTTTTARPRGYTYAPRTPPSLTRATTTTTTTKAPPTTTTTTTVPPTTSSSVSIDKIITIVDTHVTISESQSHSKESTATDPSPVVVVADLSEKRPNITETVVNLPIADDGAVRAIDSPVLGGVGGPPLSIIDDGALHALAEELSKSMETQPAVDIATTTTTTTTARPTTTEEPVTSGSVSAFDDFPEAPVKISIPDATSKRPEEMSSTTSKVTDIKVTPVTTKTKSLLDAFFQEETPVAATTERPKSGSSSTTTTTTTTTKSDRPALGIKRRPSIADIPMVDELPLSLLPPGFTTDIPVNVLLVPLKSRNVSSSRKLIGAGLFDQLFAKQKANASLVPPIDKSIFPPIVLPTTTTTITPVPTSAEDDTGSNRTTVIKDDVVANETVVLETGNDTTSSPPTSASTEATSTSRRRFPSLSRKPFLATRTAPAGPRAPAKIAGRKTSDILKLPRVTLKPIGRRINPNREMGEPYPSDPDRHQEGVTEGAPPTTTTPRVVTTLSPYFLWGRSVEVACALKIMDGAEWSEDLEDHGNPAYQELSNSVGKQLDDLYKRSEFGSRFKGIQIEGFSRGSVIVDYTLYLTEENEPVDTPALWEAVSRALVNGTNIGDYVIDPGNLSFEVVRKITPPPEISANDGLLLPHWAIAVIVIAAASSLFLVILCLALTRNKRGAKRKYGNPLKEESITDRTKHWDKSAYDNLGAASSLYDIDDTWDEKKLKQHQRSEKNFNNYNLYSVRPPSNGSGYYAGKGGGGGSGSAGGHHQMAHHQMAHHQAGGGHHHNNQHGHQQDHYNVSQHSGRTTHSQGGRSQGGRSSHEESPYSHGARYYDSWRSDWSKNARGGAPKPPDYDTTF